MKNLLGLVAVCFVLISSTALANKTSMHSNWTCSTNASSSDVSANKSADKKMSQHTASASKSFKFAKKHCRDCTKITCEMK